MMQIPPPSQLSLLTSMFGSENDTRKGEKRDTPDGSPRPMPEERQELSSSNIRRKQQLQQQQSLLLGGHDSSLVSRNIPVLRPQQQSPSKRQLRVKFPPLQQDHEKLQPRKMTRRKSPSQKIPRSNSSNINNNNHSNSIPSDHNRFEKDENGNPKLQPHTCFSYRTMEKHYEKDTLRMLERIQKSRSFEKQQQQRQQEHQQGQEGTHNASFAANQRSLSLKDLASEDYHQLNHNDSGFYIGDADDDECDGYGHFNNNNANDIHNEINHHQDGHLLFEEEEEIFELDL